MGLWTDFTISSSGYERRKSLADLRKGYFTSFGSTFKTGFGSSRGLASDNDMSCCFSRAKPPFAMVVWDGVYASTRDRTRASAVGIRQGGEVYMWRIRLETQRFPQM